MSKKKYKIIEPFFKKEKKLKDIEEETNISYATLKRWVSRYKESGIKGLEKKERSDKNSFKKVNDEAIKYLKGMYKKYHDLSVSKLYELSKEKLNILNTQISYSTFFRIVNNLDENIKKESLKNIKKDKVKEYGVYLKEIVLPYFTRVNKVYYIYIFFNKESYEIVNFLFSESKKEIKNLFNFFRKSIIMSGEQPKHITLSSGIEGCTKNILRTLFFTTNIEFIDNEEDEVIKESLKFLDYDLYEEFKEKKCIAISDIEKFLKRYFFVEKEFVNENKLLYFLERYSRKVYSYGIRIKNKIYSCKNLEKYENEIVDLYFDEDSEVVFIYKDNKFIGKGELRKDD